MVQAAGTDWMQDTIDANAARNERLDKETDFAHGDFEAEALEGIGDIENELIGELPAGVLTRLAIMAAYENPEDYLGPNYDESQGADDGADFRREFEAILESHIEHLKNEYREQAA